MLTRALFPFYLKSLRGIPEVIKVLRDEGERKAKKYPRD